MKDFLSKTNFTALLVRLWKNGYFFILVGQFLTKFVAFFGSVFVVRLLTKDEYGYLSIYENTYSYLSIVAGFGLSNAIIRYVILGTNRQEQYDYYHYAVKNGFLINILIVALSLLFFLFRYSGELLIEYRVLFFVLALGLPFQDLYTGNCYNERAMFSPRRFAVISFLGSCLLILGRVIGAKWYNVYGVAVSQLIIYLALSFFTLLIEKRTYYKGLSYNGLLADEQKTVCIYSFQYMITNSFWAMIMLNSVFLLQQYHISAEQIADYRVACVFPSNIGILSTCLGLVVGPNFTKHEEDLDWIRQYLTKILFGSALMVGILAVILVLFAFPIIQVFYGDIYINTVDLMRWLTIGAFINAGIRYPLANALAAMGKIKYNLISSAVGIVLQILFNVLLIPIYGVYGTAVASILIYSAMSFMLLIVCYLLYFRKPQHKKPTP